MSHVWADESCPEQPRRPRERRQVRGLVVHTPWRRRRKSRHFPSLRFVHFACLFETNTTIIIGSELLSAYSPDQTVPPTACDQPPHSSLAPTTSQARGHALDLNGRKRAFVQKHPAKGAARPGAGASPVRGIAQPHPARHPAAVLFRPFASSQWGGRIWTRLAALEIPPARRTVRSLRLVKAARALRGGRDRPGGVGARSLVGGTLAPTRLASPPP